VKVDSGLCQPAGTPIAGQLPGRLGVTFCSVDAETDVLRPVHTRLTNVQAALDTLTIVFPTADATRLARVAFRHFYDFDALEFSFVFEDVREPVECPPV